MGEWVWRILSLSLAGTLLALVLVLVQPLARRILTRRVLYVLWIVVLVRMLVPVGLVGQGASSISRAIPSPTPHVTSAAPTDPAATVRPTQPAVSPAATVAATAVPTSAAASPTAAPTSAAATPTAAPTPTPVVAAPLPLVGGLTSLFGLLPQAITSLQSAVLAAVRPMALVLVLVWAAGVLASLLLVRARHAHFQRALRMTARPPSEAERLLLEDCRRELGVRRPIGLARTDSTPTPFLLGVFRTTLYLPARDHDPVELRLVFLHELMHRKFFDLAVKWLAQGVCAVHWFNPFVHVMQRQVSIACELACDESVVRRLTPDERATYGEVLIRLASAPRTPVLGGAQALSESGQHLQRRLQVIAQKEGHPRRKRIAGLFAVLLLTLLPLPQLAPFALTGCAASPTGSPLTPSDWMGFVAADVTSVELAGMPANRIFETVRTTDRKRLDQVFAYLVSLTPTVSTSDPNETTYGSGYALTLGFAGGKTRTFQLWGNRQLNETGRFRFDIPYEQAVQFDRIAGDLLQDRDRKNGLQSRSGTLWLGLRAGNLQGTMDLLVGETGQSFVTCTVDPSKANIFDASGVGNMGLTTGDRVTVYYRGATDAIDVDGVSIYITGHLGSSSDTSPLLSEDTSYTDFYGQPHRLEHDFVHGFFLASRGHAYREFDSTRVWQFLSDTWTEIVLSPTTLSFKDWKGDPAEATLYGAVESMVGWMPLLDLDVAYSVLPQTRALLFEDRNSHALYTVGMDPATNGTVSLYLPDRDGKTAAWIVRAAKAYGTSHPKDSAGLVLVSEPHFSYRGFAYVTNWRKAFGDTSAEAEHEIRVYDFTLEKDVSIGSGSIVGWSGDGTLLWLDAQSRIQATRPSGPTTRELGVKPADATDLLALGNVLLIARKDPARLVELDLSSGAETNIAGISGQTVFMVQAQPVDAHDALFVLQTADDPVHLRLGLYRQGLPVRYFDPPDDTVLEAATWLDQNRILAVLRDEATQQDATWILHPSDFVQYESAK